MTGLLNQPTNTLSVRLTGDSVIVSGLLLASTADLLLVAVEFLHSRGHSQVTVDLDGIRRLDSTAVHALAKAQRQATHANWQLRIRADSPMLRQLLATCDLQPHPEQDVDLQ